MTAFTSPAPGHRRRQHHCPGFEFDGFGCSGKNQSPVLQLERRAPEGTKSFAVNVMTSTRPRIGLLALVRDDIPCRT